MKKLLILGLLLFVCSINGHTTYLTEQTYKVVPDITNIKNDWYFDGDLNVGTSTSAIKAVLLDDGKLGLGLSTPSGLVEVSTGTSSYSLYISSIGIQVGIGTNSPTSGMELDVVGDINSTSLTCITGTATDLIYVDGTGDDLTLTYGVSAASATITNLTVDDFTVTYGIAVATIVASGEITADTLVAASTVTAAVINTGQGANELYDMNQNVVTTSTPTFGGQIIHGYSQLGSNAPAIRLLYLSTTTAAVEGGKTTVTHGVTNTKIISVHALVEYTSGLYIPQNHTIGTTGYEWQWLSTGTVIEIQNHPTLSENILSKPVKIVIIYEE